MASKTQAQVYLDNIAKSEQEVVKANAKVVAERAETERQANDAREHLADAKAAQKAIQDAWGNGDTDAAVGDYQAAGLEVTKWTAVRKGRQARAKALVPQHTDASLAERVADVLRDYFEGSVVEVGSTFTAQEPPAKASALPVVVVSQQAPTRHDANGYAQFLSSGDHFQVSYYRTAIMAKIDVERLEKLAKARDLQATFSTGYGDGQRLDNGAVVDVLDVKVTRCDPSVIPPIPNTPDAGWVEAGTQRNTWPSFYSRFLRRLDGAAQAHSKMCGWHTLQASGVLEDSNLDGDTWTGTVVYGAVLERRRASQDRRVYQGEIVRYKDWSANQEPLSDGERDVLEGITNAEMVGSLIPQVGVVVAASKAEAHEFHEGDESKGERKRYVAFTVTLQVQCKPQDLDSDGLDDDRPLMTLAEYAKAEGLA